MWHYGEHLHEIILKFGQQLRMIFHLKDISADLDLQWIQKRINAGLTGQGLKQKFTDD